MGHDERSNLEQALLVQQRFDLLLSRQATAQAAMLAVIAALSASDPEAHALVGRVEAAMDRATDANIDLLEHLSDVTACFETKLAEADTKH
jgi:hypothetical protein